MSPLLYIFLLALAIALMLYWVVSSLERGKNNTKEEKDFRLETAQELFKYLEPEQGNEQDKDKNKGGSAED